jgi:hypothetical protein
MKPTWNPQGCIFPPPAARLPEWVRRCAAAPFAVAVGEDRARVFFTGRDDENRGRIGACIINLDTLTVDPDSITREPLLDPGPLGAFDESGCTVSCVVRQGDRWLLYYTGWMLGRTVPFYLAAGLAVSEDCGRTFRRHSPAPLLDRNAVDPFLTASPAVLQDEGVWRMWYVSAVAWEPRPEGVRHQYLIKYAESNDGIRWRRAGRVAIPFDGDDEYAMGRPHVVKDGSLYRMSFCSRGDRYRIAFAESDDAVTWRRCADVAAPAPAHWDAEMQAYPMILRDRHRWLMFYNGNGYGATGFGCATTEILGC